jgi:predicted HTH transcriptional regulator
MTRALDFGGTRRIERWTYPPEAVREAIVNSIIHADYSQIGGPIRLAIYDDRLEVENPGLLPAGVTIEDLRRGVSKPRNRVIARFFHEIRLAEQWGSGVRRMTDACAAAGLAAPEFEEFATHFRVILRAAGHGVSERPARRSLSGKRISDRDALLMELLSEFAERGGASARELAERLKVTDRTVRSQIALLVREGRVVAVGSGPHDPQRRYFPAIGIVSDGERNA